MPALSAALVARDYGARVVVLESAPRHMRGGNSRHTRNCRCMHEAPTDILTEAYPEEEYYNDLLRVTGGQTNEALARLTIRESEKCPAFMAKYGVRFQPSLTGTLHLSRTNAFYLGGGKALVNEFFAAAERLGIDVLYDAEVVEVTLDGDAFKSVTAMIDGQADQDRGARAGRRLRRLRGQFRLAEGGVGTAGRQFHLPRHALQHRQGAQVAARRGRAVDRRSDPVPLRWRSTRARRNSTAASSRGSTASRSASSSTSDAQALLRRGRGLLAQALRHLGPPGGAAAGPDRLFDHRRQGDRRASCRRCSRRSAPIRSANSRARWDCRQSSSCARSTEYNRAVKPGTFDHQVLDDCTTVGPDAGEEPLGAPARHAAVLGLSAAAGHHLHVSRASA